MASIKAGTWQTRVKVQCRNEEPFMARIRFQSVPTKGLVPFIDCPWCGRGYSLNENGEWYSDRPLKILETAMDSIRIVKG